MMPRTTQPRDLPLGVVLAGGQSSRYGSPKALARVGGERIVDRVVAALQRVTPDIIVSANDPDLFADLGLPVHPDRDPDLGPLAGIHTCLLRAREVGRPGILAVACDMPFPCVPLLDRLRLVAFGDALTATASDPDTAGAGSSGAPSPELVSPDSTPDVVLPESGGRRGVEPLFGAYRTTALPAIAAALEAGDRRMVGFHDRVEVRTIPLDVVQSLCDPKRAFLNVNRPEDRARAESLVDSIERQS